MRKSILAVATGLAMGASLAHATDSQIVQRNMHSGEASQSVIGVNVDNEVVQRNSHKVQLDSDQKAGVINNEVIQRNAHSIENHVNQNADTINNYIDGKAAKEVVEKTESNHDFITEVDVKAQANGEANVQQDAYIAHNARSLSNHQTAMQQGFRQQQVRLDDHERRITGLESDVEQLRGGIALGIAVGTLQYDVSDTSGPQVSIATGYYSDHTALAIGVGAPLSENAFFNLNASSTDDGQMGAGAGVTWKIR